MNICYLFIISTNIYLLTCYLNWHLFCGSATQVPGNYSWSLGFLTRRLQWSRIPGLWYTSSEGSTWGKGLFPCYLMWLLAGFSPTRAVRQRLPSLLCPVGLSIWQLTIWHLASPEQESEKGAKRAWARWESQPFVPSSREEHPTLLSYSIWQKHVSRGRDYTRVWIPGGQDHWEPF